MALMSKITAMNHNILNLPVQDVQNLLKNITVTPVASTVKRKTSLLGLSIVALVILIIGTMVTAKDCLTSTIMSSQPWIFWLSCSVPSAGNVHTAIGRTVETLNAT